LNHPSQPPYLYIMKKQMTNHKKIKTMKATKFLAAAALALIVISAAASNPSTTAAGKVNSPDPNTPPDGNIKYEVLIHAPSNLSLPDIHFFVVLTDGNGRRIAYQQFVPGINTYQFSEAGPVNGTRIVKLVESNINVTYLPFSCNPDVKTGIFRNGVIYKFNLYPTMAMPE
jgi:hypothetical protein